MNQKRFSIKIRSCDIVQNRQKIVLKLFLLSLKRLLTEPVRLYKITVKLNFQVLMKYRPNYYIYIASQFSVFSKISLFFDRQYPSLHSNNPAIFDFAIFGKLKGPNLRKLRGHGVLTYDGLAIVELFCNSYKM